MFIHSFTNFSTCVSFKDVKTIRRVLDLLHAHGVSPFVLTHKPAHSVRYPDLLTFVRYIRTQIR